MCLCGRACCSGTTLSFRHWHVTRTSSRPLQHLLWILGLLLCPTGLAVYSSTPAALRRRSSYCIHTPTTPLVR
eukprot:3941683-Rhodomonas_salina.2